MRYAGAKYDRAWGLTIASGLAAFSTGMPSRILQTGTSSFFPDSVRGIPGTAFDFVRDVPRRQRRPQRRPNPDGQFVGRRDVLGELDVQQQPALLA
ncbi:hypothetical protein GCM10029978_065280 [Actinoallomurus acanthiterrae]